MWDVRVYAVIAHGPGRSWHIACVNLILWIYGYVYCEVFLMSPDVHIRRIWLSIITRNGVPPFFDVPFSHFKVGLKIEKPELLKIVKQSGGTLLTPKVAVPWSSEELSSLMCTLICAYIRRRLSLLEGQLDALLNGAVNILGHMAGGCAYPLSLEGPCIRFKLNARRLYPRAELPGILFTSLVPSFFLHCVPLSMIFTKDGPQRLRKISGFLVLTRWSWCEAPLPEDWIIASVYTQSSWNVSRPYIFW